MVLIMSKKTTLILKLPRLASSEAYRKKMSVTTRNSGRRIAPE